MARAKSKSGIATVVAQATVAPVVAAQPVALRGGLVAANVKSGPKPYRVKAAHNVAWAQQITNLLSAGNGTTSVQSIVAVGVPATMVGYMLRRGYLAAA
jgi:hypothetical protein